MTEVNRRVSQLSREEKALIFERLRQREQEKDAAQGVSRKIGRRIGSEPAPLSFAQQRLWFLDRLHPGDTSYNMPQVVRILGPLDPAALARALHAVVQRHEALRTTFHETAAGPVQVVAPDLEVPLPLLDLSRLRESLPEDAVQAELRRILMAEVGRPFDLRRGPLLHGCVARMAEREHVLILSMHHIVSDGWSLSVLVRDIGAFYGGSDAALPALQIQYPDFAVWQRGWLQGTVLESQIAYWRQRLAGAPASLDLPTDRPRPAVRTSAGSPCRGPRILGADADRVRRLSREVTSTPFLVLLAGLQAVLARHSGQEDICVGTAVANRNRVEVADLIGFFVNNLVLRGDLSGDPTFRELLNRLRTVTLEAYAHQDLPFEKLVEELRPERDPSRTALFQVMLVLQNTPNAQPPAQELRFEGVSFETAKSKFDFTQSVREAMDGFWGWFDYSTDLFDRTTLLRLARHQERFLSAACAMPDRRLSELPLLEEAERSQIVHQWNDTGEGLAGPSALSRFEAWAARAPEAPAVAAPGGEALSFGELDRRASALAARLRGLGVGPEERVGLFLGRSAGTLVGLLGVWKAGGAWVPLDPSHPAERLAFTSRDAGLRALVTEAALFGQRPLPELPAVLVDELTPDAATASMTVGPSQAAYVLYTSGSTGQPKGAVIEHGALANYLAWVEGLLDGASLPAVTSLTFDASLKQLLGPLLSGRPARILPEEVATRPEALLAELEAGGYEALNCVPSLWSAVLELLEKGAGGRDTLRLRRLLLGGQALPPDLLARTAAVLPGVQVWNLYGPTEATANATAARVAAPAPDGVPVPLGRALPGLRTHVLDRRGRAVPMGVLGELCVAGAGLSRGYLGRPDLTADRFVPDPFADAPGGRLYRTGDVVRRRPDGQLEFRGRTDDQVKVRGFRVELGEIEARLGEHPQVRAAAVLAQEAAPGDVRLVACVVPSAEGEDADSLAPVLRAWLRERLPEPMVPSTFVWIESLPLTATGKPDRRALAGTAAAAAQEARSKDTFVAPRNLTEELLAGLWADVLGYTGNGAEGEDGARRIGAFDDFFALGGHSLLATQLISRIRGAFELELPLSTLFERPTLAGLAEEIERERHSGEAGEGGGHPAPPIRRVSRGGFLPLSFAQQRLWFLDQLEPGTAFYNMLQQPQLLGPLKPAALQRALTELVRRHEGLRTTFGDHAGKPYQVVAPAAPVPLPMVNLDGVPAPLRERELARLRHEEARRPFDLATGPLLRATLVRGGDEDHTALFTVHHIVSDGWSTRVLIYEMATLYAAFSAGRPSPLPELPIQYVDYAVWQREWLQGEALDEQIDYWRRKLDRVPGLQLPTDRPRPAVETFRGTHRKVALGAELSRSLQALSRREGVTLFMTLLAGFSALLGRWTGQSDIPVGSPIANRHRAETESLIGFFANTLVLRADLSGDPTFRQLLARVRTLALEGYARQEIPFEKLVEELQPERDMSRNPLFQVMMVLQNQPQRTYEAGDLLMAGETADPGTAKFDLTQFWWEGPGAILGILEHNTDLFDNSTMQRFFAHQEGLLAAAAADPDRPVSTYAFLSEAERHQIAMEWNETADPAPEGALEGRLVPIHQRVERQAALTPDLVAVSYGGLSLTYRELEERANRMARGLIRLGVKPEALVGICVERSLAMVTATLAVLKAGGALVALDPAYPVDRLAFIARDARLAVLLTQESMLGLFPDFPGTVLLLDGEAAGRELFPDESPTSPGVAVDLDHPIYGIYTSGSTGQPKGIVVTHRAFANLLDWQLRRSGLVRNARTVQLSTFGFCVSFQEIFSSWTTGSSLVLAGEMTRRDIDGLAGFLDTEQVERLYLPFAALKHLAEVSGSRATLPGRLREVITAGEQLQVTPAVRALFERLPGCALHNQYGASETHVVSALALGGAPGDWPAIPAVGRPISNVEIHLLDAHLEPAPIGVAAELYAGGACLARGYLNDPVLTAQKLIPDPFAGMSAGMGNEPGARLYRTGDQARRLADGSIEYHGRLDGQVKIRGFRVELGEVETTLAKHPGVRDVAVLPRKGPVGDPKLVAWVVPQEPEAEASALFEDLRSYARRILPEHMVPSGFVAMAALPVNANGKLDREALPVPDEALLGRRGEYVPPRNEAEEALAGIWGEVLGVPKVGIHDSFFELGGHSLLATQLVSRVRDRFAVEMPLRALFEEPTIAGLAGRLPGLGAQAGHAAEIAPPIRPVPREGPLPLSFAQERMWVLHRLAPRSPAYNMPVALRLEGSLRPEVLAATLRAVVERHEALRTTFQTEGGQLAQRVEEVPERVLAEVDLRGLPPQAREAELSHRAAEEAAAPFDLAAGPLLRATLVRLAADDAALLLTQHHIVSDGWSLGVLVREVVAIYQALSSSPPSPPLPPLPIQYADFAAWQRDWLSGERLEREMAHWRERLDGLPMLRLPADHPRPAGRRLRGGTRRFAVPPATRAALNELARAEGATSFMVLLAAFAAVLSRHAGQDDFAVGTPVAGRNRSEIEGLIGFFVNSLVLRADLSGSPGLRELVRRARQVTLEAYAHQDLPFEKLVAELQTERDPTTTPLFQVLLVLQNTPSSALEVPGLRFSGVAGEGEESAKYDLILSFWELAEGMAATLRYDLDLFEAATAERLAGHVGRLLEAGLAEPDQATRELPMLSEAEAHQALVEERGLAGESVDVPLHALFEAWAARTPEAPALTFGGETVSYGELERRSASLARRLVALGAGPEARVALCLERTPDLVVAVLAVLRSGAAYVPLDPSHPAERLGWVLEDSRAGVLVTLESLRAPWMDFVQVLALEEGRQGLQGQQGQQEQQEQAALSLESLQSLESFGRPAPDNLAYVIYTSGSTGRPKGVGVTHANAVRLLRQTEGWFGFGPGDVWTLFHSFAFDFSVWEIWGALAYGGRLVIVPPEVSRSAADFHDLLVRERVTVLNQTASAFRQLRPSGDLALRWVIFGGEALDPRSLGPWLAGSSDQQPRMVNMYGITETTVHVTFRALSAADTGRSWSPIGRPIPDLSTHLLDIAMQPVPLGAAGEIFVAGPGLARGYLGQPDRTAERFVPDPFADTPGGRLYRSGDLARRLPDGSLDFLGRADQQVKIRGHRIELGEVEAALLAHPSVREAVALLDGAGDERRLVACVAADPEDAVAPADLRAFLQERLPEPMLPAGFLLLDRLPLTVNGKVDRRALADRLHEASRAQAEYTAPRGPVEETLAALWSELLGAEQVGAHDGFFALGGHSLLATQLLSRIRDHFGVELPLMAVFEEPDLSALAARVEAERSLGAGGAPALVPVPRTGPMASAPLSFAQERLWFLHQLEPGSPVHNMPMFLRLAGEIRPGLLEATFQAVAERHEILRTVYRAEEGLPVQVPTPAPERWLAEVDLTALPEPAREPELARLATAEALRPFDLSRDLPLRTSLVRLAPAEAALLMVQHHIASDGWSLGVLVREVAALYSSLPSLPSLSSLPLLPALPIQYADYAVWQRSWLSGERLEGTLAFWRRQLADPPVLQLPTDRPRAALQTSRGDAVGRVLPAPLAAGLRDLARGQGATLFMAGLAGFLALLSRSTGQEDLAVGTVNANRDRSEVEGLIGFFVNNLVLRADLGGDPSFAEVLARSRRTTLDAFSHAEIPFEKLVAELRPERSLSHTPFFQAMLVLQNAPVGALEAPGVQLSPLSFGNGERPVEFELTANLREIDSGLLLTLEYNRDLFDAATAERLAERFERLLAGAVADPARRLSELPVLSETEAAQLRAFSAGIPRPATSTLLHRLFEAQARRAPEAPAVEHGGLRATYAELEARANRLARHLRGLGVGPEARVALAGGRTLDGIAGLLAVLKAGGAYVPLDPTYPADRLAWMLRDSGAEVLLTETALAGRFEGFGHGVREVLLDGDSWVGESPEPMDGPAPDPGSLAYVVYTSGSTGTPKGVAVSHRSIAAYALEAAEAYDIGPGDRVLQFASLSFDISAEEIHATLASGACLVLRPEDMAGSAEHFFREVERLDVSVVDLPTAYWHELVTGLIPGVTVPAGLRRVILGGEEARADLWAAWSEQAGSEVRLFNSYGPTEATVVAARLDVTDGWPGDTSRMPLGRPIAGAWAAVVDRALQPLPPGVPGELLLGGPGVARGYLGRPDLTAERFVPDFQGGEPGARLYRTGDRARWRPDGNLEFLGRVDAQVKVRGFRIEPGEVEAALHRLPEVAAAVVAPWVQPGRPAELAAWVVPAQPGLTADDLRRALSAGLASLPAPLVPSAFVFLEALPMTPGGKVDRRRLPAPERQASAATFQPPGTELERELAAVWAEVLGLERVGLHDNFFDLGGHSLLLPRVQARVKERLGRDLPLLKLFEHPSVGALAANLANLDGAGGSGAPDPASRERARRQRAGLEAQRQRLAARRSNG